MVKLVYDVPHQVTFGWLIACYFYLTGLSAGSFILSTLAYGFGVQRYKPIAKTAIVTATLLLVAAPIFLLLQVGWPVRSIWNHFVYLNFTSPMTYGGFLLVLYPLNCLIYGLYMFRNGPEDLKMIKLFGFIGIPLAITVHGYTGFILAFGKARALWNTALMPTLFLVSAIVSGIALMILIVIIKERFFSQSKKVPTELVSGLAKLLGWMIVVDLFLVFCDVTVLLISHEGAQKAALLILGGSMSPLFVGIENLFGKLVPLYIVFSPRTRKIGWIALASALVVIGIFFMRYVTVFGGQFLPMM